MRLSRRGYSVMFRTAPEILADLHCDSPQTLRRKLNRYGRPALLAIDEVGYLSYDTAAADLLYEVVNRRYERRSILITTNKAFKDWEHRFPQRHIHRHAAGSADSSRRHHRD